MKSDISRQTFDPRKHYSRVVMQQGRVQLDADWNEQQDIMLHHIETQARDVIGASGASLAQGGFALTFTPDSSDLIISPGSLYVDGILCELEEEMAVPALSIEAGKITLNLPDVDNQPFLADHWAEVLDADEQHIGFFKITSAQPDQEQNLLILSVEQMSFKPPKGDSSELFYNVRPVMTYKTQPNYPLPDPRMSGCPMPDEPSDKYMFLAYLDVWQRQITALDDPDIREVALGGADTTQRSETIWQVKIIPIEIPSKELAEAIKQESNEKKAGRHAEHVRKMTRLLRILTFRPPLSEWNAPAPTYTGKLSVRTSDGDGSDTQGYRGLENQLYHVEVQEGSDDTDTPTFKWARDNGSTVVMGRVDNHVLTIQGSGQGALLGLQVGQYVELITEDIELHGLPGHLAQIQQIDDITGQITLSSQPPDDLQEVKLRLWNGSGTIDDPGNTDTNGWIPLENGIEIQFLPVSTYRSGDYWLIPARTTTGQIDWPHSAPQPPMGVQHHYTRLACLLHTEANALAQDCRQQIYPLGARALHIIDINWRNDVLHERSLLREGLHFILDGEPDQECASAMQAAISVTLETALPGGGSGIFLINGIVEIERNIITWHWDREEQTGFIPWALSAFDKWKNEWFERHERYIRVRVTIKGHYIWQTVNSRHLYLDGQVFGIPGSETSGHRPPPGKQPGRHIDLHLPSGSGRAASNFEGWFYLRE